VALKKYNIFVKLAISTTQKQTSNMTPRQEIGLILNRLHPSDAIALIESIGKELRKKNSIRINRGIEPKSLLLDDRPDLEILKVKPYGK